MGEIVFLALLGGAGIIYLVQAGGYKTPMLDSSGGPALFPQLVCWALLALVTLRIIQILIQKNSKKFRFFELFRGSMGFMCISTIVMVVLMQFLGFILTCFAYLTVTGNGLLGLKQKSLGTAGQIVLRELIFVTFTVGLYIFFTRILYVALPDGLLRALNF